MKIDTDAPKNIPKKRIKWPFSLKETALIHGWIYNELKVLSQNTGDSVNYELFCQKIINKIESLSYAPELVGYFESWKTQFENEKNTKIRNRIFAEFFLDLQVKWLIPKNIFKLYWEIPKLISTILQQDTTQ